MLILGIETSCDETAAAIVKDGTQVISSVIASSENLQKNFGGIIPEQAAREQVKCIIPVILEAIQKSKVKSQKLDAIAVTYGPGLIGSLLIGIETAKALSLAWNKPIIPVNHLLAHLYANFIHYPSTFAKASTFVKTTADRSVDKSSIIHFPAIGLIVSGGHTQLVLMNKHKQYKLIGTTRDDAAGECFDKCSRLLGLGYPGGPAVEAEASRFKVKGLRLKVNLPRPMINDPSFDFSFSGLKTAVYHLIQQLNKNRKLSASSYQLQVAYELQEAITDVLVEKTLKAAQKFPVKSILIGGGVASNQRLRDKFESKVKSYPPSLKLRRTGKLQVKTFFPKKVFCTDNAASIAACAFFNFAPLVWSKIKASPNLTLPS